MSTPDDPVSAVSVAGSFDVLGPFATTDGIDWVRGSATEQDDGSWTLIGYATQTAISSLQSSGVEVTLLANSDTLDARWTAVQGQVER